MIQLEDKLYTSTEVADILGVSLRSVYRYLEENKLDAEVKTATGRHRFSKKNILDFLYPDGNTAKEPIKAVEAAPAKVKAEKVEKAPVAKKKVVEEPIEEEEVAETSTEEPIDWLAKFREAAKKYREESEKAEVATESESMSMADTMRAPRENPFTPAPVVEKKKELTKHYYRSSLGGLKDIAQNIDRGSRNSFLDYAFTLNAGLSLYKPIKPFSMLHAYVKPGDLAFFEKLLGLTHTDEANAQLCLILSDEASIYRDREELHGLYVVSKDRLATDVETMGDASLTSEAAGVLR